MPELHLPLIAWPWLAAVLPLPWLLRWWLRPEAPGQALRLPQPGLSLASAVGGRSPRGSWFLLGLAWLCLVGAAVRPQWLGPPQAQEHSGRAMMLVVDLSGSMGQQEDMVLAGQQVSRFAAVKAIAGDFISRRSGDELGLVLFGSQAYLVTPLTYDLDAVHAQLAGSAVGLAGTETAIGDAIAVAVKRLASLPAQARVVVLLTDGVNNAGTIEPLDATRAAKAAGVRIYAIGIGADRMTVQGIFGSSVVNPSADLDVGMLTSMANDTGGRFFRATDTSALADAYRSIDALEPMTHQGQPLRPHIELFRWPLAAGLVLVLLASLSRMFRRRTVA